MIRLATEEIGRQLQQKLRLLMSHYSIPNPDDWFSLALALARDHVPGLRVEPPLIEFEFAHEGGESFRGLVNAERKRGGRPAKWDFDRLDRLLAAVEAEKRKHGLSTDREALSRVAARGEWVRPPAHRGGQQNWIETLESRYHDAKRFRRLLADAEKLLADASMAANSGKSKGV
jgi:hypothetical protein